MFLSLSFSFPLSIKIFLKINFKKLIHIEECLPQ